MARAVGKTCRRGERLETGDLAVGSFPCPVYNVCTHDIASFLAAAAALIWPRPSRPYIPILASA